MLQSQISGFSDVWFVVWLLYFLIPANILIYGVNDIADFETDSKNAKKQGYEKLVMPAEHKRLLTVILATNVPFLALAFYQGITLGLALSAFWFFSVFYSLKPIRFKGIPFLDGMSNILYVLPGVFGFLLAGGGAINWQIVAAGTLWAMAMHAYSAVPDIQPDSDVGIQTTAVYLGKQKTLRYCLLCYVGAGVLAFPWLGLWSLLAVVYVMMMLVSMRREVFAMYRYFPYINAVIGMLLFFIVLYLYVL